MNLYQPFVARAMTLTRPGGRIGLILPWGFATDDGAAGLRRAVLDEGRRHTFVGLDNARGLFPIHRGLRFFVAAFTRGGPSAEMRARFGVATTEELENLPENEDGSEPTAYPLRFSSASLGTIGGPSRRIPDIRRISDLALLERLRDGCPALGSRTGWHAEFGRELNATEDRAHFSERGLPVVDGKHLDRFSIDATSTRHRIPPALARQLLPDRRYERARLGYRDVSGTGNKWPLIAAIVPAGILTTHTIFCLRSIHSRDAMDLLCAIFNSYVLNAVVRMLMGGHVTSSLVESLPVPARTKNARERRIVRLSRRLRTADAGPDTEARLQAEVARLYDVDVQEFERLLESFPLVPADARERAARARRDITPDGMPRCGGIPSGRNR